jgi:hypothetical protein
VGKGLSTISAHISPVETWEVWKLLRSPAQQLLFLYGKELTAGRSLRLNLVETKAL